MRAAEHPTGTVTFLFTDIEGSTRLWESDHDAMREALSSHDAILREAIERHRGFVFKTVGDAFCAAFFRPEDALSAAVETQLRLAAQAWPAAVGPLRVRVGIHAGSAVESDGDYFGPTVNRVARLMSLGHGEQILISGTVAALLRDVLPERVSLLSLGTHRLKDLSQPEPTFQVAVEGLRSEFPPLRSLDARPNNLPFQISSFVGRARELGEVRDALGQRRLVTVVGPGGIGKTRVALAAAGEAIERFVDGVWLVQLSQLKSAELIAQAAADVLNVREVPQEPVTETVVRTLADSESLLVFDSAEHLVAATAAFVKLLLSRCAGLKVLITSREPLHVTGEHVVRVQALEDAAELFLERAREVAPNLVVDEAALRTIGEICRRVERIPLAIELAAARVATLPLAELSARLARRLNVLVSRDTTKEERHRTLRATIAWSYDLLDPVEAEVFRALGVFEGAFEDPAMRAVTNGSGEELDVIDALVGKSLVSLEVDVARVRYVLPDAVREFVLEQIERDGSLPALAARHFAYFSALVATTVSRDGTEDVAAWLDLVGRDADNVRAALMWACENRPGDAAALAIQLARYWKIRGHISEGRASLLRLLRHAALAEAPRAALLRRAATFATLQDDYDEARRLSDQCLAMYEGLGDVGGVAEALHNLAVIEQRCGNDEGAAAHYVSALAKFREVGHHHGEWVALMNMALIAFVREDLAEAERCIDAAAGAAARTGDVDQQASVTASRGELALRRGDFEAAARFYRPALELKRAIGNSYDVGDLQNSLAIVAIRRNRLDEARASAAETLRIAVELEASSLAIYGFEAFAEIAIAEGRCEDAARYYGLSRELRRLHSYRPTARKLDELEHTLRAALGDGYEAVLAPCAQADWRAVAADLARGS